MQGICWYFLFISKQNADIYCTFKVYFYTSLYLINAADFIILLQLFFCMVMIFYLLKASPKQNKTRNTVSTAHLNDTPRSPILYNAKVHVKNAQVVKQEVGE